MQQYMCEQCNYSTSSGLYFERHLEGQWHKSGTGPKTVHCCELCNWRTSKGKYAYEKHLQSATHTKNLHIEEVKKNGFYCHRCAPRRG